MDLSVMDSDAIGEVGNISNGHIKMDHNYERGRIDNMKEHNGVHCGRTNANMNNNSEQIDIISNDESDRGDNHISNNNSDTGDTTSNDNSTRTVCDIKPSNSQSNFFTFTIPEEDETLEVSSQYTNSTKYADTVDNNIQPRDLQKPSLSQYSETKGSNTDSLKDAPDAIIMERLKATAQRLNLRTRRQSIITWQHQQPSLLHDHSTLVEKLKELEQHDNISSASSEDYDTNVEDNAGSSDIIKDDDEVPALDNWSDERIKNVNDSISWLRKELLDMKAQDVELARTLMTLRQEMQRMRLRKSSMEHRELLEDAIDQQQDQDEQNNLCDAPPDQFSPTLKKCGVTRMNLTRRRFSVF